MQNLYNTFPDVDSLSWSQSDNYYEMYELLLSYINDWEAASNTLTLAETRFKIWLEGVIGVNKGVGAQSDFIRNYNNFQAELRFGEPIDPVEMDRASDQIAQTVIQHLITAGTLLPVSEVAGVDVATVTTRLLNNDSGGWAGNPLLLFLGYGDAYYNNILGEEGNTYNLFAMLKTSYEVLGGWEALFSTDTYDLLMGATATAWRSDAFLNTVNPAKVATYDFLEQTYGSASPVSITLLSDIILDLLDNSATINGTSGRDFIHAADGNDTIMGSLGMDVIDGGEGWDRVDYSSLDKEIIVTLNYYEDITATFTGAVYKGAFEGTDIVYNVEHLIATDYDDVFLFHDLEGYLTIDGGDGIDELSFFYYNQGIVLYTPSSQFGTDNGRLTFTGVEKFTTTSYNDFIVNAEGNQIFNGGAGNDTISYHYSPEGVDVNLISGVGKVGTDEEDILINIENAAGSFYDDYLEGNHLANFLDGGDGADTLNGGAGNDTLRGGSGNDWLDGGADNDLLIGGGGIDKYFFNGQFGNDIIQDWGGDEIYINGSLFSGIAAIISYGLYALSGYTLYHSGNALIISGAGGTITLEDWQDGWYGITLQEIEPEEEQMVASSEAGGNSPFNDADYFVFNRVVPSEHHVSDVISTSIQSDIIVQNFQESVHHKEQAIIEPDDLRLTLALTEDTLLINPDFIF